MKRRVARTVRAGALVAVLLVALGSCRRTEPPPPLFQSSDTCAGCHNGLRAPTGEDVSIQREWAPTMMANAARDPYWLASVRREISDGAEQRAAIEDECSICHMPMTTFADRAAGRRGVLFARLPSGGDEDGRRLAGDGVSCTVCHQIARDGLGSPASFGGHFTIDTRPRSPRLAFGRFAIDEVRAQIMSTGSGFTPTEAQQIRQSEMCATCHTLFTGGEHGRERLPEQVPYLEWLGSGVRGERSCQSCHMPRLAGDTPIASVVSIPRPDFARHTFVGANLFMARLLASDTGAPGVPSPVRSLAAHADETGAYLRQNAATVTIEKAGVDARGASFMVRIAVLAGHKLPTAYPSRRAWLHVRVRDARGQVLFESGAIGPDGAIRGNDNDADAGRYEPHYAEITRGDQVQIYESIMVDERGSVTTGLLGAVEYVKDNRLLPNGFDKTTAAKETSVRGDALHDPDFVGGGDSVRYAVSLPAAARPPFSVEAELRYQPIAYRWAQNLRRYTGTERFVLDYEALARASSVVIADAKATIRVP